MESNDRQSIISEPLATTNNINKTQYNGRLSSLHSSSTIEMGSPLMTNVNKFMGNRSNRAINNGFSSVECKTEEYRQIALKISQGTLSELNYKDYANYLGSPENYPVLKEFVKLLKPYPLSLLSVLKKLSSTIYFIAEAQNIDRILEEISKEWVKYHPSTMWKSNYKLSHIILFSLLILNSDIHNEDPATNQFKFSVDAFVENTLFALEKEAMNTNISFDDIKMQVTNELISYYESLRHKPLPLYGIDRAPSSSLLPSESRRSRSTTVGSLGSEITRSESFAKSYRSMNSSPEKEPQETANWKFHHGISLPQLYIKESFDEEVSTAKDSILIKDSLIYIDRSCLQLLRGKQNYKRMNKRGRNNNSNDSIEIQNKSSIGSRFFRWLVKPNKQSIFRGTQSSTAFMETSTVWTKIRLRITEGRIFLFNCSSTKNNFPDVEDYKKESTEYYVFNLFEAEAQLIQDNVIMGGSKFHSRNLKGNFSLTFPPGLNDSQLILNFETESKSESAEYVQCINFWAARLSPIPFSQFEIVSNEEYGWSDRIFSRTWINSELDSIRLCHWKPLLSADVLYDHFDEIPQPVPIHEKLRQLSDFVQQLAEKIDDHNAIKPKLIEVWGHTNLFEGVMENWNSKYLYLNKLFKKRKVYLNVLESVCLHSRKN